MPLGSVVTERKIAAELNVSKTPVREALAQMRNEGLVTIFPQSGVRVFTLSAKEVREICAFRKALEAAALTLAMQVHPRELKNALSRIVDRMEKALDKGDQRTYLALDTDFHLTFFDWCDNGYLKNSSACIPARSPRCEHILQTSPNKPPGPSRSMERSSAPWARAIRPSWSVSWKTISAAPRKPTRSASRTLLL